MGVSYSAFSTEIVSHVYYGVIRVHECKDDAFFALVFKVF